MWHPGGLPSKIGASDQVILRASRSSAGFAAIKARLARAYLDHKADIGAPHATDQDILDRVDDITALMLGALGRAMAERRHTWLEHYGWFTDLVIELLDDVPPEPLDG